MKWRGFGTESPSGLHCMNWYWSTDHPMDRSSNRLCIGFTTSTNPDRVRVSCSWVRISPNGSESLKHATVHISHTHTYLNIITHVLKHTLKHTQYVHVLIHVCNNMYTYNTYIHAWFTQNQLDSIIRGHLISSISKSKIQRKWLPHISSTTFSIKLETIQINKNHV